MVRQRAKAVQKPAEDGSWIAPAMETCRDLTSMGTEITTYAFANIFVLHDDQRITTHEAEQRLRKLTNLGWLHMKAARNDDGTFRAFVWEVR